MKIYDIVVVSFSDIRFDGRTRNLIDGLVSLGKKIIVFSISKDIETNGKWTHIEIKVPTKRRVFIKWISFINSVKNYLTQIDYQIYYACDLYSLIKTKGLIYDSREIYSALSTLHNSPFRQKIISLIEKHYIKYVKTLVTSGELDTKHLKDKYKLQIPCYEIYNFPEKRDYFYSKIREKFNIKQEKIILLYQGVILAGRGLKPILNAIKNDEKYILLICGDGPYRAELEKYISENNINNLKNRVIFAGNIDYASLHEYTCGADIGLCNIEALSLSYKLANPNKLYEYILAELPILATDLPVLSNIINKYKIGQIISENNEENEILQALNDIFLKKEEYKTNIKAIKNNFVYENQHNLIKKIVE